MQSDTEDESNSPIRPYLLWRPFWLLADSGWLLQAHDGLLCHLWIQIKLSKPDMYMYAKSLC